jgi:hypothetical protein
MTLSKDCNGCPSRHECKKRYITVGKGGTVYCPDGNSHPVDIEQEWLKN